MEHMTKTANTTANTLSSPLAAHEPITPAADVLHTLATPAASPLAAPCVLEVRKLCLNATGTETLRLVDQISLSIRARETLALMGSSGSGKSLTAMAVMGLLPPGVHQESGSIQIIGGAPALIMQNPGDCFDHLFTVRHTFRETFRDTGCVPRKREEAAMRRRLREVGFADPESILSRHPFELSGGMLHRLMIALALVRKSPLIIADEPIASLDLPGKARILRLLKHLQARHNFALLYIDHDLTTAANMADSIAVMQDGRIVEQGLARDVLRRPRHEHTKELLHAFHVSRLCPPGEKSSPKAPHKKENTHAQHSVLLECRNLKKSYGACRWRRQNGQEVLRDISLRLHRGESLAVMGRNGAGKSTLFRLLLGLEKPDSGNVLIMGKDIGSREARQKNWRRHVQTVFQDSRGAVNPRMTVGSIIEEPLLAHGLASAAERKKRVAELLSLVNLPQSYARRYPGQLSGGQLQRVCIARALAPKPDILLLDEALTDLDAVVRAQLQDLLESLKNSLGLSLLYVSHDMASVFRLCDRVVVLNEGCLVDEFRPDQHLDAGRHESFERLLRAATELTEGQQLAV